MRFVWLNPVALLKIAFHLPLQHLLNRQVKRKKLSNHSQLECTGRIIYITVRLHSCARGRLELAPCSAWQVLTWDAVQQPGPQGCSAALALGGNVVCEGTISFCWSFICEDTEDVFRGKWIGCIFLSAQMSYIVVPS